MSHLRSERCVSSLLLTRHLEDALKVLFLVQSHARLLCDFGRLLRLPAIREVFQNGLHMCYRFSSTQVREAIVTVCSFVV